MTRVGQNRISATYMTVCMAISLLKIPFVQRVYYDVWFWPTLHGMAIHCGSTRIAIRVRCTHAHIYPYTHILTHAPAQNCTASGLPLLCVGVSPQWASLRLVRSLDRPSLPMHGYDITSHLNICSKDHYPCLLMTSHHTWTSSVNIFTHAYLWHHITSHLNIFGKHLYACLLMTSHHITPEHLR